MNNIQIQTNDIKFFLKMVENLTNFTKLAQILSAFEKKVKSNTPSFLGSNRRKVWPWYCEGQVEPLALSAKSKSF